VAVDQVDRAAINLDAGPQRRPPHLRDRRVGVVDLDRAQPGWKHAHLLDVGQRQPGHEPDPNPAFVRVGRRALPPALGEFGEVNQRGGVAHLLHRQQVRRHHVDPAPSR